MSDDRLATLEECQLKYIQAMIEADDPSSNLLRTFADNWFAFKSRGPFLTRGGRPRWWNKPSLVSHGAMLRRMHSGSKAAVNVVRGTSNEPLAVDHAVPLWAIRAALRNAAPQSTGEVRDILGQHYFLVVVTHGQHAAITRADCARRRADHRGALDWRAFYDSAGIELVRGDWASEFD